jgi:hypothetical protein
MAQLSVLEHALELARETVRERAALLGRQSGEDGIGR